MMTRAFFGTTDLLLILNQSMRIVLRCKENNIQKPQLTKIVSQGRKDTEGKRTQGENTDICHRSDGIAQQRDSRCLNSNYAISE